MEETFRLAADFATPSLDDWRALVERGLKGAAFEQRLVGRSEDGLRIEPLYTRADELAEPGLPGAAPFLRGATAEGAARAGWDVRQQVCEADPAAANRAILEELEGGATSILLHLDDLALVTSADLDLLLEGVLLDLAPVHLRAGAVIEPVQAMLAPLLRAESSARLRLELDPIGSWARGHAALPEETLGRHVDCIRALPDHVRLLACGPTFHDAGASDAQELGLTLAAVLDLLRLLDGAGIGPETALRLVEPSLAIGCDYFAGIAKLRAWRRIVARMAEVVGVQASPTVHAVTSARMLTRYDAWTNLLRLTIACAAAGLGGADAITVLPHDQAIRRPDAASRRLARNVQAILLEESQLYRVIDPAGGSWYVEQATEQLARAAWQVLQQVEGQGGLIRALKDGAVQALIAETRQAREARIRRRRQPITGTSEFADAAEPCPARLDPPAPVRPALASPLPVVRDAEPFERLRDRAAGRGIAVPIVTLGPPARHTPRLTFAQNLLAAAGLLASSEQAPGPLVLLAGADEDCAEADAAAAALKAAGFRHVHLMGKPPGLGLAAIDRQVRQGDDVVAYLEHVLELVA